MGDSTQGMDVGDAVLTFLGDTTQLDVAFKHLEDQASSTMGKAASSVDQASTSFSGFNDVVDQNREAWDGLTPRIAQTSDGLKQFDGSVREARESLKLIEESLGIQIPRGLNTLLAEIPGLTSAFSAMLPIAGVLVALTVIGELIEKHEKLAEAQRHAAEESETLEIKQNDLVLGLHGANLALEDQIRKLEGRPEQNRLVLAMIDVKKSVDDLVTTYATDFQKMDSVMEEQMGLWVRLKQRAMEVALVAVDPTAGIGQHAANQNQLDQLRALTEAEDKLNAARRKLNEEDPQKNIDAWKVAAGVVATAAGEVQKAADNAHAAVQAANPDLKELLGTLHDKATLAKAEWQSLGEKIKTAGLEAKKAKQETANDSADRDATRAKEALDAQIANIKLWASAQHVAYDQGKIDLAAWLAAQQRATGDATKANEDYIKKLIDIYHKAGDAEKERAATQKLATLQTEGATKANEELAKSLEKNSAAGKEAIGVAEELARKSLQDAKDTAQQELKITLDNLKEKESALELSEKKGELTKKQVLLQTEQLIREETAAKLAALQKEEAAELQALAVEEQAIKTAMLQITDSNDRAKVEQKLLDIERQREELQKKIATEEHTAATQSQADLNKTKSQIEEAEKAWSWWVGQMKKDVPSLGQAIRQDLQGAIDKVNQAFSRDFAKMILTGKGFGKDMKALASEIGTDFISMMTSTLLKWVETQIAMKVLGISTSKSTASGEIAASAAAAGANMIASWSAAPWPIDAAAPAMGAMAFADAMAYLGLVGLATGGVVMQPTMAMFGEKGEEAVLPLTDPQAMERISNALLSSPTMRIASVGITNPSAIAAASNIRQGGFDDASMAKLADRIGDHVASIGGTTGDIHVHQNIKGLVSPDTMKKHMRYMSKLVQQNRASLHSSNSLRVTRRSP